jgi:hypothetical protein
VLKVGSSGGGADMASTMMQKFWDSALTLEPPEDDDDSHSDISARLTSEAYGSEVGRQYPSLGLGNSFCFKLKLVGRDGKESNHRFNCGSVLDSAYSPYMHLISGHGIWERFKKLS